MISFFGTSWRKTLLLGALYLAAVFFISATPTFRVLDLKTLDFFRTHSSPHPDIVIVAIDNKSIGEIGRWPWSRRTHAELIEIIGASSPRAIGIDITFSEPEAYAPDSALATSLQKTEVPVVLAAELISIKGGAVPHRKLPPFQKFIEVPGVSYGYVNADPGVDGTARLLPQTILLDEDVMIPFSREIANRLGVFEFVPNDYQISFAGPAGSFPTISASDVIAGRVPGERFREKIVLVGVTASNLHDIVSVPLPENIMAGVEWHANVLDNILLARPILNTNPLITYATGAIIGIFLIVVSLFANTQRVLGALLVAVVFLPLFSYILWEKGIAFPFFTNLVVVAGTFAVSSAIRWYRSELERKKLRERVQNYFSPNVMEAILKDASHLRLGGERREITILFSDIRSFTTMAEGMDAGKLTQMLHRYFTEMTEEIFSTDGVLDKFIGDAIMAFWGAPLDEPDHPERAVHSAMGMLRRLEKLRPALIADGFPDIDIGIGIHTGFAIVGNMGSEKRFDYTVIGDSVNIASRLEGLNKEYKTHLIISEDTARRLPTNIKCREIDEVIVKGKTKPIKIFEVLV